MGWTFEAQPIAEGTYWVGKKDGTSVGGIYEMKDPRLAVIPEHWLGYVAVDEADAIARKIKSENGLILREPFDVPGVGRFAIARDANGAVFAVTAAGDGATNRSVIRYLVLQPEHILRCRQSRDRKFSDVIPFRRVMAREIG